MLYASQVVEVGYLSYVQNLWEYPPGRYAIIGGLCGLVVLVLLLILCVYLKRRQQQTNRTIPSREDRSAQEQLDLVRRVRRWSRNSPKRFSSFIPTGPRQTTNYSGSISDANMTPLRGQAGLLRPHYPTYYNEPEFY